MDKLLAFFKSHNLKYQNKTFVLAVSTGIDSSVLLDMFIKLKNKYNIKIIVSHVNHHKRAQSEEEKEYIVNYCKENNIICVVKELYFETTNNFQEEARNKRYMFFEEVVKEYRADYLVLAHHAQDNTETVLMRLLRGSSLKGYSGINGCNHIKRNDSFQYMIIRPLINYQKEEIEKYQRDNNIKYYSDASNLENDYTRNRIRNNILPILKNEAANLDLKVLEFSDTLYNASLIIDEYRDSLIDKYFIVNDKSIKFKRSDFYLIKPFMQEEVLFELLKQFKLSKNNINELIKLIYSKNKNYHINYKKLFEFIIEYDYIIINKEINNNLDNSLKDFSLIIDNNGKNINDTFIINDKKEINVMKINNYDVTNLSQMCYNISSLPITIRTRRDGDKIKLKSGYKKVNDLFIDLKISKEKRDNILLCVDSNNEVLLIFGVRRSEILKTMCYNNNEIIKITLKEK